jgi:hypothetical protein
MATLIGALTTAEWIVAIGSAVLVLLSLLPVLWLCWLFVQMDDSAVERTIDQVERFTELKTEAQRAIYGRQ